MAEKDKLEKEAEQRFSEDTKAGRQTIRDATGAAGLEGTVGTSSAEDQGGGGAIEQVYVKDLKKGDKQPLTTVSVAGTADGSPVDARPVDVRLTLKEIVPANVELGGRAGHYDLLWEKQVGNDEPFEVRDFNRGGLDIATVER